MPPSYAWQNVRPAHLAKWHTDKEGPWQPDYFATRFVSSDSNAGLDSRRGQEATRVYGKDLAKAFIHMWGLSRRFHNILALELAQGEVANAGTECGQI